MNNPRNRISLAVAAAVCALLFAFTGQNLIADTNAIDEVSMAKAIAFLTQAPDKWSSIQTLKYAVDTKDTESDGFRTSINETGHDRDVLLTHVSFAFRGGDYGWKSDTVVAATGVHERTYIGGWTQGTLSILFQSSRSVLMVTQNPQYQSAVPITGCNPLMEAFSFLVSDSWQGLNSPEPNLSSLLSKDTWANAAKRVTAFSEETFQAQRCVKIVFGPVAGAHDVVYFPEDMTDFPLKWQHYEGNFLRRDVTMSDAMVTKLLPGGISITVPHLLTRKDYYDPADANVFCTSQQTLTLVAVNQAIDDDDIVIDPNLADSIYDRDQNKRLAVPK